MRAIVTALTATIIGILPTTAAAFCGFYVSGAGAEMFNNATQVVLMREGTRTVLSMQNNYQGPPADFAMVVPVPTVLSKEDVKTLKAEIFARVDALAAPRLVEYWEADPCAPPVMDEAFVARRQSMSKSDKTAAAPDSFGVTIEAQFTVGEYEIVILSATDSTGLDAWLRREKYQIPAGAEPLLRPYVQSGMKFFVAKVNPEKVTFRAGMATLSPLRFHYDADEFSLPVRLGMINSSGTQDLIVHILARGQRYQVANYKNATIPTNLDVKDETRNRFSEFYAALFDRTLEANPGAVVTEYAWDAATCDPCPTPALTPGELATLGHDVLFTPRAPKSGSQPGDAVAELVVPQPPPRRGASGFVLTRLHVRYAKNVLADDLVFAQAPPIAGGREVRGGDGRLEQGAIAARVNNFQGRYAIRHAWTGPVECDNPRRGIWGGPPAGTPPAPTRPAQDLAFAPRGKAQLASFVSGSIPGLPAAATAATSPPQQGDTTSPAASTAQKPKPAPAKTGKGCTASTGGSSASGLLVGLAVLLLASRRRPQRAFGD